MTITLRTACLLSLAFALAAPARAQEFRAPIGPEKQPEFPAEPAVTESGIRWFEVHPGTSGRRVAEGETFRCWYESWNPRGVHWESSWERGGAHSFVLGPNLIESWREMIPTMTVGQQIVFESPAELAYGEGGLPPYVEPGDALVFHVYLGQVVELPPPPPFHAPEDLDIARTESGLEVAVLRPGEGEPPTPEQFVHLRFALWDAEGKPLGSTEQSGTIHKGSIQQLADALMPFVAEGLPLLRPGGRLWFRVPPALGFGDEERNGLPANATTIWELEIDRLLDPVPAPEFFVPPVDKTIPGPDGLRFQYVKLTEGKKPAANDLVRLHYIAWNKRGEVLESSFRTGEPAELDLGRLLSGYRLALQHVPVGGILRVSIPPERAYGPRGKAPLVGPDEKVYLYVELLEILEKGT